MKKIVAGKPLENHHGWQRFDDGVEGVIDLSNEIEKGVFKQWEDWAEFDKVPGDDHPPTHLHVAMESTKRRSRARALVAPWR